MKKLFALLLVIMMMTAVFTSCSDTEEVRSFVKKDYIGYIYVGPTFDEERVILQSREQIIELEVPFSFYRCYAPGDSICPVATVTDLVYTDIR